MLLEFIVFVLFIAYGVFIFRALLKFWKLIGNLKFNYPDVYEQFLIDTPMMKRLCMGTKGFNEPLFFVAIMKDEKIIENEDFRVIAIETRKKIMFNLKMAFLCVILMFLITLFNPVYMVFFAHK